MYYKNKCFNFLFKRNNIFINQKRWIDRYKSKLGKQQQLLKSKTEYNRYYKYKNDKQSSLQIKHPVT